MPLRLITLLALAAAAACAVATAAEPRGGDGPRIVSPRPDSVSITIYRDLVALVTETRTVDLPATAVTLELRGVVDSLIAQSAVLSGADRGVLANDYDFDRLTADRLLEASIGKPVWLTRTSRATGKSTQVAATLVAANESGVLFRTADGTEALHCSGLPEKLTFEEIPGELRSEPTLSVRLAPGAPGRREVRVSYIATGFAWSADYVGRLAGEHLDLGGWLTLENFSGSSFRGAEVQVVAGRLNLLDAAERGSSAYGDTRDYQTEESVETERAWARQHLRELGGAAGDPLRHFSGCYPLGANYSTADSRLRDRASRQAMQAVQTISSEDLEEVVVTGTRQSLAARENLADYQMYRLPDRTDLAAHQTKQVAFLAKPGIRIERFYGVRLAGDEPDLGELEDGIPAVVKIGWRNVAADGLGEPLPSGIARFFETGEHGDVFVGDARLRDSPVGTPIEVGIGRTPDVDVRSDDPAHADLSLDSIEPGAKDLMIALLTHRAYVPVALRIVNAKSRPVVFELRQGRLDEFADLRVKGASLRPQRKSGDYAWRLTVPANGEALLSYRVGGRVPDFDD